jgi:hypothetical protein
MNGGTNPTMINIERVIVIESTLVLMDLGSARNLISKVFATNFGHSNGTMDPSRILLPNGQVHSTNLFMKDVPIQFPRLETYTNFQVWLGNVYDVILDM